jgi:DNA repair protein RadD
LDFSGNVKRNGPINDPVIPKRKGKKLDGEINLAPVKLCMTCSTWNHASLKVCSQCGGEFPAFAPADPKINATASTDVLIVGAPPQLEVFKVERVEYEKHLPHHTSDKPPSLKVRYHCAGHLVPFLEYQCFEHIGFASKKAREWWREMANDWDTEPPATIDEAVQRLASLQRPTHVKVYVNTKHPKIEAYDFGGSAFGTEKPKF